MRIGIIIASLLALLWSAPLHAAQKLLVFAPSSLTDVVQLLAKAYEQEHGQGVVVSLAGTSQLARQVESGAAADVFISADRQWVDWLLERKLLDKESTAFAGNSLVVAVGVQVENWADIKGLLTTQRFAMGEPQAVPAGRYAKQALEHMGWWPKAQANAVFGENVRVALKRVSLGEVGAAIVYATDARADAGVKPIFTFPAASHSPIYYWANVVSTSKSGANAAAFVDFLRGSKAQAILQDAGFEPARSN